MKKLRWSLFLLAGLAVPALAQTNDGYWIPKFLPGDNSARMKTLDEIEPRTMIKSLPFVITNSGAYYLPGTLAGSPGTYGILIQCDDVKIDLNGFAINGVSNNSLSAIACTQILHNITVQNGTVRLWQQNGVDLIMAFESRIERVTAFSNGKDGIRMGGNSYVEQCGAFINGGTGIVTGVNCSIMNCKAGNSGYFGMYAGPQSKISSCISSFNGWGGIMADDYCTVRDCTTTANMGDGIRIKNKCRIEENNSGQNGWVGIRMQGQSSRIERNNVVYNTGGGILSDSGAKNNLVILNTVSSMGAPGYVTPQDYVGSVVQSNQMSNGFSNANPWANFLY